MTQQIIGEEELKNKTIRSLGLTNGGGMIRLLHRSADQLRYQANESNPLVRTVPPIQSNEKIVPEVGLQLPFDRLDDDDSDLEYGKDFNHDALTTMDEESDSDEENYFDEDGNVKETFTFRPLPYSVEDKLNVKQGDIDNRDTQGKLDQGKFSEQAARLIRWINHSFFRQNKDIFIREIISNANIALDKIRIKAVTDKRILDQTDELSIRIRIDKRNLLMHITDTGSGMGKEELVKNLGTSTKPGLREFLIGLDGGNPIDVHKRILDFGVGFYSVFLVADKVTVTSKTGCEKQQIWESNGESFSVLDDPQGDTLKRGTQITLKLKWEAQHYFEENKMTELIKNSSQSINFPVYLTEQVVTDDKLKIKKVCTGIQNWKLLNLNDVNHIWTREPGQVEEKEYAEFYKIFTQDAQKPLAHTHFVAEGIVSFKALLFVPAVNPSESLNEYRTKTNNIKLYVRRVFITDDFKTMLPNYLDFVSGVVDSDDLPLNVFRETGQKTPRIKSIINELISKSLEMIENLEITEFEKFWKEYSKKFKQGMIEDIRHRSRIGKLIRFDSSGSPSGTSSFKDYVGRMKDKQAAIYYMAGSSREEVEKSPFVENLLKEGYEVIYLTDDDDEDSFEALAKFEEKLLINVAKDSFSLNEDNGMFKKLKDTFKPLTKWLGEDGLKDQISKAIVSERLDTTSCVLIPGKFGWTGNKERVLISRNPGNSSNITKHFSSERTLEINPRHRLIQNMLRCVNDDPINPIAKELALTLLKTATIRSGYAPKDNIIEFVDNVEASLLEKSELKV